MQTIKFPKSDHQAHVLTKALPTPLHEALVQEMLGFA
jgi:hypothetical protein